MTMSVTQDFEQKMRDSIAAARRDLNWSPSGWQQLIRVYGGIGAAKRLLAQPISPGLTRLFMAERLDLSVEALVVRPRYAELFTDGEIATARRRLGKAR